MNNEAQSPAVVDGQDTVDTGDRIDQEGGSFQWEAATAHDCGRLVSRPVRWEYVEVTAVGHHEPLSDARNALVSTTDGRYWKAKMPKEAIIAVLNELGEEGWELVSTGGSTLQGGLIAPGFLDGFAAMFKRPITEEGPDE